MTSTKLRTFFGTAILGIAYLSLVLQWFWVLIVGLPPLIKTGAFDAMYADQNAVAPVQFEPIPASPLVMVIVGVLTVLILLLTFVTLWRIPKAVVKGGDRVVTQATTAVIPVITHHQKITEKKRRGLSRRLRLGIQIIASIVPFFISLFLPSVDILTSQMIIVAAGTFAVVSVMTFTLAWLLLPGKKTRR